MFSFMIRRCFLSIFFLLWKLLVIFAMFCHIMQTAMQTMFRIIIGTSAASYNIVA